MAAPPGKQAPPVPEATRLESDEDIRQALLARQARARGKPPPAGQKAAPPPPPPPEPETPADRPQQRPPMALLCVVDDSGHDGEWVRLRADRCVLGRTEGEVRIPHDLLMSGRHAELTRRKVKEGYRWVLTDLGSTNGTWVRVGSTVLHHQAEIVVGRGHYRFEGGAAAPDEEEPAGDQGTTRPWTSSPVRPLVPSLVEVTPAGPGPRQALALPEYWIGRDPKQCAVARPDDLFANPRHARLYRDPKGQWHVENHKSVNGVWLRVAEIPLGPTCQFRLGEQRFLFRVL